MNKLKMIGLAIVVSAGMAMAQAPSQAPDAQPQQNQQNQQNQNQNANPGATPAAPAAGAATPNSGQKMPATASPLELIALLGLGTLGVGAALRKPRFNQ